MASRCPAGIVPVPGPELIAVYFAMAALILTT